MELLSGTFTFRHVVFDRLFEVSGRCTGTPVDFGIGAYECHGIKGFDSRPGIEFDEYIPERISAIYDEKHQSVIFHQGLIVRIDYDVQRFKEQWPDQYEKLENYFYEEMPDSCAVFEELFKYDRDEPPVSIPPDTIDEDYFGDFEDFEDNWNPKKRIL